MEPHSPLGTIRNATLGPLGLLVLLRTIALAESSTAQVIESLATPANLQVSKSLTSRLVELIKPFIVSDNSSVSLVVGMVKLTVLCGLGSAFWFFRKGKTKTSQAQHATPDDVLLSDPGLLKKHSATRSYFVPATQFTYPGVRTFYRSHPQEAKLPTRPRPIPLLVFIHGLGGSVAQFSPILLSLSNLASCLSIDLPGCGLSSFEPQAWEAYTTEALVHLLAVVIEAHRLTSEDQSVILIGHSMGCSLAALLASRTSPLAKLLAQHVSGLVVICPQAEPLTEKQAKALKSVTRIPPTIFDLVRQWDRRGSINSRSVLRMSGPESEEQTRRLQLRFNQQSRSAPWQRMARGMCPDYSSGMPQGGLPGRPVWAGLDVPIFIAAGEADHVTPAINVNHIVEFLGRDVSAIEPPSERASLPIAVAPFHPDVVLPNGSVREQDSGVDTDELADHEEDVKRITQTVTSVDDIVAIETASTSASADAQLISNFPILGIEHPSPHPRRLVVKTAIMPKPASHSLLFAPSTSRILAGLIGTFITDYIDPRLSLAWQLNYLSTEGKWDVKNLEKWKATPAVSGPIAGVFRAMKTLREVDDEHTPKVLVKTWAGELCAIIDISHDNPVYDPKGLEDGGIPYHKFPTVSKHPPPVEEVKIFIDLVDKIRAEKKDGLIGVHCHYGFNRTGFFVVSYLIEKLGYKVEDAIDVFQQARPPGIRHSHFIDTLHVRYCHGLKKAPTL